MKCKNEVLMQKVTANKLDKQVEVDFSVQRKLPDCRKINTKRYVSTSASTPTYNMYKIPSNQFECMSFGCVNSGTLFNNGAQTVYLAERGEDFAAGVIAFYAILGGATGATVTISDSAQLTNANTYTVDLTNAKVGADGFTAVVVDLSQTPTTVGTGWTPSENAAYIAISLTGTNISGAGISSIAIFEEMDDFATSTHVKVGCVTGIDGTFDLDMAEASCFSNGFDTTDLNTIEKTITGNAVTANYWRLSPMYQKGTATEGFDIVTIEKTIVAEDGYGVVKLADMNQNECGFFSAQLATCLAGDGILDMLTVPSLVALDEKHYMLVNNEGETTVVFNAAHVGMTVLISYPKVKSVEEFVISADGVNDIKTRMSYVKKYSDGTKYRFVYDNVYVTSFPDALTEDETEFSFTISIQKDANGVFGRAYKILD